MPRPDGSIPTLVESFQCAFKGIKSASGERNIRIHYAATIFVIAAGIFFKLSLIEWCIILDQIGAVIAYELFNTAIEKLADVTDGDWNQWIGRVKDMAAGAVTVRAMAAAGIGAIIFIPRMLVYAGIDMNTSIFALF